MKRLMSRYRWTSSFLLIVIAAEGAMMVGGLK